MSESITHPPCPRRDRWIRGCRFEPRYDKGAVTMSADNLRGTVHGFVQVMEASKPITYVRDVCVTCGRTVERTT